MALKYTATIGLENIMPVLDEHVIWYGKLMKSYFEGRPLMEPSPMVFAEWLVKARQEKSISDDTADRLHRIHEGMVQAAHGFISKYEVRDTPPLKEYNELSRHYEEFIKAMRQIEIDQALENSGFDEKTGLRSFKVLPQDFEREMERRSRRGNPFVLALVKINKYKDEWRTQEKLCRPMVQKIADQMKDSLRSFDDAYFMGDEFFILALKHADLLGAQSAMVRLNQSIASAHIAAPDDPLAEISVSSVLSEPTKGDTLDAMIANMKKDLEGIDSKGTVLQYQDLSPLQRYIHSMAKDN